MSDRMASATAALALITKKVKELEEKEAYLQTRNEYLQNLYENAPFGYQSLDRNGCLLDVNASRQAEKALRESENRLRLFVNQAPASLAMFDTEMRYLSASRRWMDDYRLGDRNLAGLSHYSVFSEISESWRNSHRRGLSGEVLRGEAELFKRPDGTEQWLRWEIQPWNDASGKIGGIIIFTEDITEVVKAQAILQRYELLAEQSRDIILFVRLEDGRIIDANAAAVKAYGYTSEELSGCTIKDLRASETVAAAAAQMTEADRHGLLFETMHRRKDGTTFPVEVGSQGGVFGGERMLLSVIRDITDRKLSEEKVNEEAELRRMALKAADLGAWEYDFATGEVVWDEQCRKLWGVSEGDRIDYEAVVRRIHPEDREVNDRAFTQALSQRDGNVLHRQFRVIWPDGSEHWIETSGRMFAGKDDGLCRPVRFVGVDRDITAYKHSEVTRARLAAIVESSDDAIIAKDLNGIISSWNSGAEKVFGYRPEEVVGRPITLLIPPEMHDQEARILQRLTAGERLKHFETVRITKDGRRIDVSLTASPVKDEEGRMIGISKIARDITERKRAEASLQKAFNEIRTLRGIIPICAGCKRIRDDTGFWSQVEVYVRDHTEAEFSHSLCPECVKRLYPEYDTGSTNDPK